MKRRATPKLKRCPFCGGKKVEIWSGQFRTTIACEMKRCLVKPEVCVGGTMNHRAKTVFAWNQRPRKPRV